MQKRMIVPDRLKSLHDNWHYSPGVLVGDTLYISGAIGIREPAPEAGSMHIHVIDHWRHLGTARDEDEVLALLRGADDARFDADSYRIIGRALQDVRPRDLLRFPPRRQSA